VPYNQIICRLLRKTLTQRRSWQQTGWLIPVRHFFILFHHFCLTGQLKWICFTALIHQSQNLTQMIKAFNWLAHLKLSGLVRTMLLAFAMWLITMLLLGLGKAPREMMIFWGVCGPFGILLYCWYFQNIIPAQYKKRRPFFNYIGTSFLLLTAAWPPFTLLFTLMLGFNIELASGFAFANSLIHFFFTSPLLWLLYRRQLKASEELFVLKKELGRSTANFDFLRSQINPHFLFNALNTIYGTAIQEGAERTSEGIEKLGDMMRFMLHENMQEKISLTREIEYLNNYISLQRLRTDPDPIIKIDAHIEEPVMPVQIAPMLLIPFVENAFKHGISFRESSYIKITLEVKDKVLNFDVYNSKHIRPENDPEKKGNGIGLNNVKQRLQLLYPRRHELIIRETGKDFFVHLTLQL
jgi:two-component system, LytTR family, sensor kinase